VTRADPSDRRQPVRRGSLLLALLGAVAGCGSDDRPAVPSREGIVIGLAEQLT
jgi:hypothetical protein